MTKELDAKVETFWKHDLSGMKYPVLWATLYERELNFKKKHIFIKMFFRESFGSCVNDHGLSF